METPERKKSKVLKKEEKKSDEISPKANNVKQSVNDLSSLNDAGVSVGKTLQNVSESIKLSGLNDTGISIGKALHSTSEALKAWKNYESSNYLSSLSNKTIGLSDWANVSKVDTSGIGRWASFTQPSSDNQMKLLEEITELKRKLVNTTKQLSEEVDDKQNILQQLNQLNSELQAKEKINHIIPRIHEEARAELLKSSEFLEFFGDATCCDAVVVSIDIRRSTELMLKARKPELFSKFITELSSKLSENIISNYGIFDKFTGDGILAFFPKFYSGEEAMVRALKSAEECHEIFDKHYHASKGCFNVFINDVGLGIGIDYGAVTLVNTSNELTVVGIPVVYACRMSGAKAGDTILNQPAKEEIEKLCSNQIKITDTTILIKNEGTAEVYKVDVNPSVYSGMSSPNWINEIQNEIIAEADLNGNDSIPE